MSSQTSTDAAFLALCERLRGPAPRSVIHWTVLDRAASEDWEIVLDGAGGCSARRSAVDGPADVRVQSTAAVLGVLGNGTERDRLAAAGRLRLAGDPELARRLSARLGGASGDAGATAIDQRGPILAAVGLLRGATRLGGEAMLTLLTMFLASVGLWLGVPVGAVWVGAQVQGNSKSVGATIVAGAGAAVIGIVLLGALLHRLDLHHRSIRATRGLGHDRRLLDVVMTLSAFVSVGLFAAWFLLRSGAEVAPVGIGH